MNIRLSSFNPDVIGMSASLLCAIHCAALPLIISMSAVSHQGQFWHNLLDFIFLPVAIILIVVSLVRSIRKHGKKLPLIIAILGLIIFFIGKSHTLNSHFILTTIGGLFIAVAHFQNWLLLRRLSS